MTVTNSTGATLGGWALTGLPFTCLGYGPAFTYYTPSVGNNIYGSYVEATSTTINMGNPLPTGASAVMVCAIYFV
jgi:hypothetical protein